MKSAGKMIFAIGFVAAFLILYVHGQVSLFRVSYLLDDCSDMLTLKSEEYRRLKFEVEQLKAPRLLEERMKEYGFDLTLPKEIRVVRVPAAVQAAVLKPVDSVSKSPLADGLMNMVGRLVGVAQAKTEN